MNPITSLSFWDLKNAPWPQSCCRINSRTKPPAVGAESNNVSQYEYCRLNNISVHNPQNSMTEESNCHALFQTLGSRYCASRAFASTGARCGGKGDDGGVGGCRKRFMDKA